MTKAKDNIAPTETETPVITEPTFSADDLGEFATTDEVDAMLAELGVELNTTRGNAALQYIRTGRLDCESDAFSVMHTFGLEAMPPFKQPEPTPEQLVLAGQAFAGSTFVEDDPLDVT